MGRWQKENFSKLAKFYIEFLGRQQRILSSHNYWIYGKYLWITSQRRFIEVPRCRAARLHLRNSNLLIQRSSKRSAHTQNNLICHRSINYSPDSAPQLQVWSLEVFSLKADKYLCADVEDGGINCPISLETTCGIKRTFETLWMLSLFRQRTTASLAWS